MRETRRLHPSAVIIYSASALRGAAVPLMVILGATVFGSALDTHALLRAAIYGGIGVAISVSVGMLRYRTTHYWLDAESIHHHTGALRTKDTVVRLERIEAVDVNQGPLQRLFGVFAVDIQTGAGGKGGEIALPALTATAVAELRAARPGVAAPADAPLGAAWPDETSSDGAGATGAGGPSAGGTVAGGPSAGGAAAGGASGGGAGGPSAGGAASGGGVGSTRGGIAGASGAAVVGARGGAGRTRRLGPRELLIAALTAGQFGIVIPVLAGLGQVAQELFDERRGRDAIRVLPHSEAAIVAVIVALLLVAWLLSIAGAVIAFGGFAVTRDGDRLRISRGLVQRREATVPIGRIRAVRVVEGVLRRPFGLAALAVEVTGYAGEAAAARTLFPLVRVEQVERWLDELLPEFADDPRGLARPPARAARRYVLPPALAGAIVTAAAWRFTGPVALVAFVAAALYGRAAWRHAGWRLADGRLVIRELRVATTTILAPARFRESHTISQTELQRHADLADLSIAFGKRTTARIRNLDAADARAAWAAL